MFVFAFIQSLRAAMQLFQKLLNCSATFLRLEWPRAQHSVFASRAASSQHFCVVFNMLDVLHVYCQPKGHTHDLQPIHLRHEAKLSDVLTYCVPGTEERNQYMLVGKASHPAAEAHLQLACEARTHLAKKVAVPNILPKDRAKKDAFYKVFSDLDFLGGKEGVQVAAGGTESYTMHILAPRTGDFNGSITFTTDTGACLQ